MRYVETLHQAYLQALSDVWYTPEYKCAPRGQPIREILDYSFRVSNPVNEPIITHDAERNEVIADYTAKEIALYDSCSNRVEDFAKASKFWNKLANPDGTVNSAYGYLIWENKSHGHPIFEGGSHPIEEVRANPRVLDNILRTPWEWAKQSLISDKDSRQAILRFSLPEHQWIGNKDQTCTMHGIFFIRHNVLNFSVIMRSNDLMLGLVYDLPWFISLMDKMIEELKPYYPNLIKGHYTHTSQSMHIYEKDEIMVLKMLGV